MAAEAPVLQSFSPERPETVEDWLNLFQDWQPNTTDRARLRKVMEDLDILDGRLSQTNVIVARRLARTRRDELREAPTPFELTVLALAGDRHGLTVAPELAVFAATLGLSVTFVVGTDHESTSTLRTACEARDRDQSDPGRDLHTCARPDTKRLRTGVTVTLVVVDPKSADHVNWGFAPPSAGNQTKGAILAVSSGFAVADDLAVVTKSAARNFHPVIGIVIANPDPADKTTGLFSPANDQRSSRRTSLRNVAR